MLGIALCVGRPPRRAIAQTVAADTTQVAYTAFQVSDDPFGYWWFWDNPDSSRWIPTDSAYELVNIDQRLQVRAYFSELLYEFGVRHEVYYIATWNAEDVIPDETVTVTVTPVGVPAASRFLYKDGLEMGIQWRASIKKKHMKLKTPPAYIPRIPYYEDKITCDMSFTSLQATSQALCDHIVNHEDTHWSIKKWRSVPLWCDNKDLFNADCFNTTAYNLGFSCQVFCDLALIIGFHNNDLEIGFKTPVRGISAAIILNNGRCLHTVAKIDSITDTKTDTAVPLGETFNYDVYIPCAWAIADDGPRSYRLETGPYRLDGAELEVLGSSRTNVGAELCAVGLVECGLAPYGWCSDANGQTFALDFNDRKAAFDLAIVEPDVFNIVPGNNCLSPSLVDTIHVTWDTTWKTNSNCGLEVEIHLLDQYGGDVLLNAAPGVEHENDGDFPWTTWQLLSSCEPLRIKIKLFDSRGQVLDESTGGEFRIGPLDVCCQGQAVPMLSTSALLALLALFIGTGFLIIRRRRSAASL